MQWRCGCRHVAQAPPILGLFGEVCGRNKILPSPLIGPILSVTTETEHKGSTEAVQTIKDPPQFHGRQVFDRCFACSTRHP